MGLWKILIRTHAVDAKKKIETDLFKASLKMFRGTSRMDGGGF